MSFKVFYKATGGICGPSCVISPDALLDIRRVWDLNRWGFEIDVSKNSPTQCAKVISIFEAVERRGFFVTESNLDISIRRGFSWFFCCTKVLSVLDFDDFPRASASSLNLMHWLGSPTLLEPVVYGSVWSQANELKEYVKHA